MSNSQIFLDNVPSTFSPLPDVEYDIRRQLDRAFSSTSQLQYGNNVITSNVQNTYNDNDNQYYVASSSLPSYDIQEAVFKSILTNTLGTELQSISNITQKF